MENPAISSTSPQDTVLYSRPMPQAPFTEAETSLYALLHEGWQGLDSALVPPRDLLCIYCYEQWGNIKVAQKTKGIETRKTLKQISAEFNKGFGYLNDDNEVISIAYAKTAFENARTLLDSIAGRLQNAEKVRAITDCILQCLATNSNLLDLCQGTSTSLTKHRPFLKALFQSIIDQLERNKWDYPEEPKGPGAHWFKSVLKRNDAIKRIALEDSRFYIKIIDNIEENKPKLEDKLADEDVFITTLFKLGTELSRAKDRLDFPDYLNYFSAIKLHLYDLPSLSRRYLTSIAVTDNLVLCYLTLDKYNEINECFNEAHSALSDQYKLMHHSQADRVQPFCSLIFQCLKNIETVRDQNAKELAKLHSYQGQAPYETKYQFYSNFCQTTTNGLTSLFITAKDLDRTIVAHEGAVFAVEICQAITHSLSLIHYFCQCMRETLHPVSSVDEEGEVEREAAVAVPEALGANSVQQQPKRRRRRKKHTRPVSASSSALAPSVLAPSVLAPSVLAHDPLITPEAAKSNAASNEEQDVAITGSRLPNATPRPRSKTHQALRRLHSTRLEGIHAVFSELQTSGSNSPLFSERKRRLFFKIGKCQELLESALIQSLIEEQKGDLLDAPSPGSTTPLRYQHSLCLLAAPFRTSAEKKEVLEQHVRLINTLDVAHSLVFYLERYTSGKTQQARGRLTALLTQINAAKTNDELLRCEQLVDEIVEETLVCESQLLSRRDQCESQSSPSRPDASTEEVGEVAEPSHEEESRLRIELNMQNRLPKIRFLSDAVERIRLCKQLIDFAKKTQVAVGPNSIPRKQQRDATLAHVERYLDWLQAIFAQGKEALVTGPFTLLLPAVDVMHRSLKEIVIAGLQHQPGGLERLAQPAHPQRQHPLLLDNDACGTFRALCDYLITLRKEGMLRYLPPQFSEELGWLRTIHDQLSYPGRQSRLQQDVYAQVAKIQKLGTERYKLEKLQLDKGWSYQSKEGELNLQSIEQKLPSQVDQLVQSALFPGIDALYLILRSVFRDN